MRNFKTFISICPIILLLLLWHLNSVTAAKEPRTCFSCNGINCLRKSLNKTEICNDPLDVCVTIFKDFTIETKGCLLNIPEEQRSKCEIKDNLECEICQGDLCNKYGRKDFICVECDSKTDKNCEKNSEKIQPIRCLAPSAINSYCYVQKVEGQLKRGCAIDTILQKQCYNSENCNLCIPSDTEVCNAPRSSLSDTRVSSGALRIGENYLIAGLVIVLLGLKQFV